MDSEASPPAGARSSMAEKVYSTTRGRLAVVATVLVIFLAVGISGIIVAEQEREDSQQDEIDVLVEGIQQAVRSATESLLSQAFSLGVLFPIFDNYHDVAECGVQYCLGTQFADYVASQLSRSLSAEGVFTDATGTVLAHSNPSNRNGLENLPIGANVRTDYAPEVGEIFNFLARGATTLGRYDSETGDILAFGMLPLATCPTDPFGVGSGCGGGGPPPGTRNVDALADYALASTRQGGPPVGTQVWSGPASAIAQSSRIDSLASANALDVRLLIRNTIREEERTAELHEIHTSKEGFSGDQRVLVLDTRGFELWLEYDDASVSPNGTTAGLIVLVILVTLSACAVAYWLLLSHSQAHTLKLSYESLSLLLRVLRKKAACSNALGRIGLVVSERDSDRTVLDMLDETAREVMENIDPLVVAIVTFDGAHRVPTVALEQRRKDDSAAAAVDLELILQDKAVQGMLRGGTHNGDLAPRTEFLSLGSASTAGSALVGVGPPSSTGSASTSNVELTKLREAFSEGNEVGVRVGSVRSLSGGDDGVVQAIAGVIKGSRGQAWGAMVCVRRNAFDEDDALFIDEMALMVSHVISRAEHEKSKMDFLAMMSHEMFTPLHGIFGSVELLNDSTDPKLSEPQRDLTASIHGATDRMLKLVGSMLNFAELGDGTVQLNTRLCDPIDVGDCACAMAASEAYHKGLQIACVPINGAAPLPLMRLDAHRIQQVLVQMLQNAIKFTDTGHVLVRVEEVKASAGSARAVRFSVIDTGRGIAPDARDRLFEMFAQGDDSITRAAGGTGMGLAVCKEIVALMHSHIEVESDGEQSGTKFSFTVHEEEEDDDDEGGEDGAAPMGVVHVDKPLRVCVDEALEPHVRTSLVAMAVRLGHSVAARADGYDVVLVAAETPADIAAMDANAVAMVRSGVTPGDRVVAVPTRAAILQDALARAAGVGAEAKKKKKASVGGEGKQVERTGRVRALACEDDKLNRRLLKLFCRKLNVDVVFAEDGQFGVEAFRDKEAPFDLIFMDLHMPRLSGYDATKEIRAMDASVPIVALTADHTSGVEEACLAAGMQAMVHKPFKKDDIARILKQWVA